MGNYIAEYRDVLEARHYIRKAAAENNYWFDFSHGKVVEYHRRFGHDFCMVIFGSETEDDAYIMPYKSVADFFSEDALEENRARWIGNIKNNELRLSHGKTMSVSAYYNAFDLLDVDEPPILPKKLAEDPVLYVVDEKVDKSALLEKIKAFNEQYQQVAPHKRRVVSEQIARPGAITDHLKKVHDYTCQLCGEKGFVQTNGTIYIEAHHITELHKLLPGSYCSDNIIVVCANCHRKLHRAKVVYSMDQNSIVTVTINGQAFTLNRTMLSLGIN
ncbi:MAG: HNH endonuclease signature motif containing protein [Anaerolineae bacterium]